MNIEEFREYCLKKKGVTEEFPFDEDTLVFKVMGKMFALTGLAGDFRINLKCNPEEAIELRESYAWVIPGYHMSKKHWNTIIADECSDMKLLTKWIDNSYELVVSGLTRKQKEELKKL
jgi:predicted DNA-binding protein (MmcQ/YjbR family)